SGAAPIAPGGALGTGSGSRSCPGGDLYPLRAGRGVWHGDALDAVGARGSARDLRPRGIREGLRGTEHRLRRGSGGGDLGAGAVSEFKDHFSGAARGYAAHRPVYPRAVAEALAARSPGRALVWDAGCGSGQLSVVLAEAFDRVVATDASAAQISSATPHPRVRYAVAPAAASGLEKASVDCAVAAQAAHWFDL